MTSSSGPRAADDAPPGDAAYPWERPLGATPLADGLAEFRVWAPHAAGGVTLQLAGRRHALHDAGYGVFETVVPADPGDDYLLTVGGRNLPDPCSRWQPEGLRGPSRLIERPLAAPAGFDPPDLADLVIYELHVGTFTEAGTFTAAIEHLDELAQLGVTAIELMPVAEFPGARGWGYDGVYLSAAHSAYGGPYELAELVDAAHDRGLAVILDVVYNHVGASGAEALSAFGPYFTDAYETPWGSALNYDGAGCGAVREWVCQSAVGWVRDFAVDGLRLDAIHAIVDTSPEHIVAEVARRVHDINPRVLVIAESGMNDPVVMRPPDVGGWGCDAAWADDFHHALRTLLTEDRDGYYVDFGAVEQLAKAFHRPHVYDGAYSAFRGRRYGAPADDVPPRRFVVYAQNHDQVGNRAFGDRMPGAARALAAFCTLLSPFTPLLFMGEEYGELAPFQFFSNHIDPPIAEATRQGRRSEFASFTAFGGDVPDPEDPATFRRSKLTRRRDAALHRLYRELIAARRRLPPGTPDLIQYDEPARWLLVQRGPYRLVCNFGTGDVFVPCRAQVIELAAGGEAALGVGSIRLPAMSGALVR